MEEYINATIDDIEELNVIVKDDDATGILDISFLTGSPGKDGERGPQGPKGDPGKDAVLPDNIVIDSNYVHTDNNFTNSYKEKLISLENYDDTDIKQDINNIDIEINNLSNNINIIASDIDTITEDVNELENKTSTLTNELLEQEENINHLEENKQDKLTAGANITIENNVISATGGSGGTTNYSELSNKPSINNVTLNGNLSSSDLGLLTDSDIESKMNSVKYDYVKDGLVNNTNTLNDSEKLKVESWLGLSENYLTYYNETPYQVNSNYNPAHKKYVDDNIKTLDDKVKELELFKFPNMTIVGTPTIQNGQVSNFTLNDYLEFPFLVNFRNRPFEINFAFTTGSNVTIQQNILDSEFGLALAIKNGHTLMAISYNGTSWNNQFTGTLNIEPNTTYVYKISWNGMLYKIQYYNGSEYVNDFYFTSTQQPYPKQMFIGYSKLSNNYFEGSINLNYANLVVDGNVVWSGMDDVGLSSRLATDLSNIDSAGIEKVKDITKEYVDENVPVINTFTNDTLGTIKGSLESGKISANNDGTATVNGFDILQNGIIEEQDSTPTNGYVRFANGLQIAWIKKTATAGGSKWETLYYSDTSMGNWKKPFTTVFTANSSVDSLVYFTSLASVTNSSAGTIRFFRPNNVSSSVTASVTAIGLWK